MSISSDRDNTYPEPGDLPQDAGKVALHEADTESSPYSKLKGAALEVEDPGPQWVAAPSGSGADGGGGGAGSGDSVGGGAGGGGGAGDDPPSKRGLFGLFARREAIDEPVSDEAALKTRDAILAPSESEDEKTARDRYSFEKTFWIMTDPPFRSFASMPVEEMSEALKGQISKAYSSNSELYINFVADREREKLVEHAWELDYQQSEMTRIRKMVPLDEDYFDAIDAFSNRVLTQNTARFLESQTDLLLKRLNRASGLALTVGVIFVFVLLVIATLGFSLATSTSVAEAIAICWGHVLSGVEAVIRTTGLPGFMLAASSGLTVLFWVAIRMADRFRIEGYRSARRERFAKYDDAINSSVHRVKNMLDRAGEDVRSTTEKLQGQMSRMGQTGGEEVKRKQIVRMLLFYPERLGLLMNYFRASMNQFVERSAWLALQHNFRIYERRLRWQAEIFTLVTTVLAVIGYNLLFAPVTRLADNMFFATLSIPEAVIVTAALVALLVTALLFGMVLQIPGLLGLQYFPRSTRDFVFSIFRSLVVGIGRAFLLVGGLSVGLTIWEGRQQAAPSLWSLDNATVVAMLAALCIAFYWSWLWYRLDLYSEAYGRGEIKLGKVANRMDVIRDVIDEGKLIRYGDIRIDQKIAEVFNSVFKQMELERDLRNRGN